MQIDWWTLALQTINVVILVWLLGRFFFKPVMAIVTARQEAAEKVLGEADEARKQADAARAEVDAMRASMADERRKLLAEAKQAAEAERVALTERVNAEAERQRTRAATELDRDRDAFEATMSDRARDLAIVIAERLLRRLPARTTLDAFVEGLCAEVRSLPADVRAALASSEERDEPLVLATAAPLGKAERDHCRSALEAAFGASLDLAFTADPDLLAGVELRGREAVVANSWKGDLDKIAGELKRDNGRSRPSEGVARAGEVGG